MISKELVRITILISLISNSIGVVHHPLETVKEWHLAMYDFPYDWPVNDKTLYDGERIVTTGFDIGDNRIFIANPRLFSGVPATISTLPRDNVGEPTVLKVTKFPKLNFDSIVYYSRHIPIGLIMQPVWSNIIAAISGWYQCTDWKLIHATACGRSMLAFLDLLKITKLRARPKSLFMIWIQIRS